MRFLLFTIGSRGDVQPMAALATRLRGMGQEVVVCAPPDFREWVEPLGVTYVPVGPELRGTARQRTHAVLTPEQRRHLIEGTVADQFTAVSAAAEGCDVIVGGGALALAAHSVAERLGIRYVYTAFAPVTLPSPHHAPPTYGVLGDEPADGTVDNGAIWAEDAERWNVMWAPVVNSRRAALGLPPVTDVRSRLFTERPWLAADPTLAPWPGPESEVFQTGAWLLPDDRPLPAEVEAFLDAGEPPVYAGFGSIRAPEGVAGTVIRAARALGRRVVLARGWAELSPVDGQPDCLAVGEVNQQALFTRVAAVVHHGGAGTTTAAAVAGAPQVIVPQVYDQFSFARRVDQLGVGSAHPSGEPTVASLTAALGRALDPTVVEAARSLAPLVRTDGASVAARRLTGTT